MVILFTSVIPAMNSYSVFPKKKTASRWGRGGRDAGATGDSRDGTVKPAVKMALSWRSPVWVLVAFALGWYVSSMVGSEWFRQGVVYQQPAAERATKAEGRVATRGEGGGAVAFEGDVRDLDIAWNKLCYGTKPPVSLNIALFVKKWPTGGTPGGLERHAMTLHRVLADRGHVVHVFTIRQKGATSVEADDVEEELKHHPNLRLHFLQPSATGTFDYHKAFEALGAANASKPFDVVHTESVAVPHWRAKEFDNLAASWHGIQFEIVHSDIVADLVREPGEERSESQEQAMKERLIKVADEVRFFPSYRQHVATSDFVGNVLRTIYETPLRNVHIILNGVNAQDFRPNPAVGAAFRANYGVPENASLVLGAAGRLVRDKGHPILFAAISEIVKRHKDVYLLVAGSGPWGRRYDELAPNVKTLGPLTPTQLAEFYNAVDIFVNPTLRAQGLDHTLLEAMQCGKPLLATHFSSIVMSVISEKKFGYTFSPNVDALTAALESAVKDGKEKLHEMGQACLAYASKMFTAEQMGSAYERLFMCMTNESFCQYPLPSDLKECFSGTES